MSAIRVPHVAAQVLQFCKPWPNRVSNPCFGTYADLMIFAAGLGYHELRGRVVPTCDQFLEQPLPIPFEIFKGSNLGLFPFVLLLSLASEKSYNAVRDEERLARTVENYAAVGFGELERRRAATTPDEFHIELAQLIAETTTEQ